MILKNIKNVLLTFLLLAIAITGLVATVGGSVYASGSGTMYVQQVSPMVVGSKLTIQVRVNSGGTHITGVQTDFTYPQGILTFSSIDSETLSAFELSAQATGGSGTVNIARATAASGGITGDFKVANITFDVIASGAADITFQNSSVITDATTNLNILGTMTDGQFNDVPGISPGQTLNSGDSIVSSNNQYTAIMQSDGNFVVYDALNKPLWSTMTAGNLGAKAVMQTDGNFVIYNSSNKSLWSSTTNGYSGAVTVMQDDGNFVIYNVNNRPIWSRTTGPLYPNLPQGKTLNPGDLMKSGNRQYSVVMQLDGNLVLLNVSNQPLWHTKTNGSPGARAVMQTDGNFVIYNRVNVPRFNTATSGNAGARLVLQSDGNLVIYSSSGKALWSRITGKL